MEEEKRVVVLIDMDCFYCQVEEKMNPELKGKPIAVVQYNPWKGGGIIAVNYVARAMGVTRHMRGDEAKEKCPEIQLPSVPCLRGKADISIYREAGKEVARVLQRFTPLLERASIDEAYMDITESVEQKLKSLNVNTVSSNMLHNTYALGYDHVSDFITDIHNYGGESMDFDYEHAKRLLAGSIIVSEIRAAVFDETGYRCSAGIAHNKILAKLVCGMNKPDKQTILPKHSVDILYRTLSLKKVKHLGGKFGDTVCEVLRISKMGELQTFTEKELQAKFDEKNGTWLYNIARGIDSEPVQAKFNPKSIGCCKQLRGKTALHHLDSLKKWLHDLGAEIEDRLEKDSLENNRTPKQMVVSFTTQLLDGRDTSSSRSYNFVADDELCGELFTNKALDLVMESLEGVKLKGDEINRKLKAPITFLGLSVGKFEDHSETKKIKRIVDYFSAGTSKDDVSKIKQNKIQNEIKQVSVNEKSKDGKEYVMQKYFQLSDKMSSDNGNVLTKVNKQNIPTLVSKPVLESTLDKQESFFAKFLNGGLKKEISNGNDITNPVTSEEKNKISTTITRICDVKNHGENSNDSDYSGSTINNEINQSIALFEDDPEDVTRVSNMRQLLNGSAIIDENAKAIDENNVKVPSPVKENDLILDNKSPEKIVLPEPETFTCTECGKTLTVDKFGMHADYHLALRLREEERQQVRNEVRERHKKTTLEEMKRKNPAADENKNETVSSIAGFLVKIDDTIPSEICTECGKRISIGKFPEHLDFHEAQKLSRELNRKAISCNMPSNSVKRKKASTSPIKRAKVHCKSIDSFFR